MQSFLSLSEIIQINRKRKVTFHEWTNWLKHKQDQMKLSIETQSALTVQRKRK